MALQRTQVLIVGGGMVGLALAIGLAKAGRKVTVVERSETCLLYTSPSPRD